MKPNFVGVDIAGAENTWVASLAPSPQRLAISQVPKQATPDEILELLGAREASAVAIDGQLSLAFSDANGFRSSDRELRDLLPPECRVWVASANSLMAVPLRARLLADAVAPLVGTILETHPRASLYLALGSEFLPDLKEYKRSQQAVARLSIGWSAAFGIEGNYVASSDGALDALVCATVAFCFHGAPERLRYLRHSANDRQGRGPFVVAQRAASGGA